MKYIVWIIRSLQTQRNAYSETVRKLWTCMNMIRKVSITKSYNLWCLRALLKFSFTWPNVWLRSGWEIESSNFRRKEKRSSEGVRFIFGNRYFRLKRFENDFSKDNKNKITTCVHKYETRLVTWNEALMWTDLYDLIHREDPGFRAW